MERRQSDTGAGSQSSRDNLPEQQGISDVMQEIAAQVSEAEDFQLRLVDSCMEDDADLEQHLVDMVKDVARSPECTHLIFVTPRPTSLMNVVKAIAVAQE